MQIYIDNDWNYIIKGKPVRFVFLSFVRRPVYGDDDNYPKDYIYSAELWTDNELISAEISRQELSSPKWLNQLLIKNLLPVSKTQYELLLRTIKPETDGSFYFDKLGIHQLNGKYYYAASNCAITADGINTSIKALQEGFDLETGPESPDKDEDRKKALTHLWNTLPKITASFFPFTAFLPSQS